MAAFSLGGLTAPFWGVLADRFRLHRWLLCGGLLLGCGGLVLFSLTSQPGLWIVLAVLVGLGVAGAATVANLFVVEVHPKSEWDERIGWLQTFYGVGQVVGLVLAGILSQVDLRIGLLVGAGLTGFAALLGWLTTHTPPSALAETPVLLHPARHSEGVSISPQRLFHHLNSTSIRNLASAVRSPFGVFLLMWLLAIGGSAAFFSQYPVLMQNVYGISPDVSSLAFAVVAGIGLVLYSPAGNWSDHFGAGKVMRAAQGIRLLAYLGLMGLVFVQSGFKDVLALIGFGFVVCAWSLISVSGTSLAASLSPVGEGEGLGIYNATNALAGVLGAILGGWVAGTWGISFIPIVAVAGLILGVAISFFLPGLKINKRSVS